MSVYRNENGIIFYHETEFIYFNFIVMFWMQLIIIFSIDWKKSLAHAPVRCLFVCLVFSVFIQCYWHWCVTIIRCYHHSINLVGGSLCYPFLAHQWYVHNNELFNINRESIVILTANRVRSTRIKDSKQQQILRAFDHRFSKHNGHTHKKRKEKKNNENKRKKFNTSGKLI